jgi:hypothetical protein
MHYQQQRVVQGPLNYKLSFAHCDVFRSLGKLKRHVEYCSDLPTQHLSSIHAKIDEGANPSIPIKALFEHEEQMRYIPIHVARKKLT